MTGLETLSLVQVPCALCGRDEPRVVARAPGFSIPLRVVRCGACGHVYLSPRVADGDLPKLYGEAYYTGRGGGGSYAYADDRARPEEAAARARVRLAAIERLAAPGRLLEVGCSFGAFLLEARRRGWEVSGVDLSPFAAAECRRLGLAVEEGTLEGTEVEPGSLTVVYLSETMEHLPHPRATVRAAARALAPGGLLVAATANHDSLARLLRGSRWGYYLPGHLQYFSARTLGRLLSEEGLPVVRRRFGDERSLLRDLLLRWNLRGWSVGAGMVLYGRKR